MKQVSVVLFAGTTEGRKLAETLAKAGVQAIACVATEYGKELVEPYPGLQVRQGRMDAEQMSLFLKESGFPLVVDATHPYAAEVSKNIKAACDKLSLRYLRLVRELLGEDAGIVTANTMQQAAAILSQDGGRALLTVGSKELLAFTEVENFKQNLFARVLPMAEAMEACTSAGFTGKQLICMQGPFSHELNVAMLRQIQADWLVTKDSGEAGGLAEKLSAAKEAGAKVLLVQRPVDEMGYRYNQMLEVLAKELGCILPAESEPKDTFPRLPLFVDMACKKAVVVGGGSVASRRVTTLLACGAQVTVISPCLSQELQQRVQLGQIQWHPRSYQSCDLEGDRPVLAVAATGNRETNRQIGLAAAQANIPCSVADAPEEGSFWFPALIHKNNLSLGLVSTNGDHRNVSRTAAWLRQNLGEEA